MKITGFDLRSLEVKGLHRLPAKQAPKCRACVKLEHNKCFLWAGPEIPEQLWSPAKLSLSVTWGKLRSEQQWAAPFRFQGVSEVVWLFQTWFLMNQSKGWDQPWMWGCTDSSVCFTMGFYQRHTRKSQSWVSPEGRLGTDRGYSRACVCPCRHRKVWVGGYPILTLL